MGKCHVQEENVAKHLAHGGTKTDADFSGLCAVDYRELFRAFRPVLCRSPEGWSTPSLLASGFIRGSVNITLRICIVLNLIHYYTCARTICTSDCASSEIAAFATPPMCTAVVMW